MGTQTIKIKPGFTLWWKSCTGSGSGTSADRGYTTVVRQDTAYRPKPTPANLFNNGTILSHRRERQEKSTWRWSHTYNGCTFLYEEAHEAHGGSPAYDSVLTNDLIIPVAQLESNIRSQLRGRSVNLANALGEYRQTANLFAESAKDLAKAWRAFRRGWLVRRNGIWTPKFGYTKAFSNRWLQYQYGVKPLYNDMVDSLKALSNSSTAKPLIHKIRFSRVRRKESSVSRNSFVSQFAGTATTVKRGTRTYRVTCVATMSNEFLNSTLGATGFTNPVSLAWELLPYSFVVDWFINVGEVLASIDDPLYFTDARYIYSYTEDFECEISGGGGRSRYERRTYYRYIPKALASPRLTWEPSLSYAKIISGLALLRQRL